MGLRKQVGGIASGRVSKNRTMEEKNTNGSEEEISMSAAQWASVIHPASEAHEQIHDASDKVPQAIEGTLAAVAASIIYSANGMSRWGLAEATLGLYKLHCRHVREGAIDTINGTLVTSITELQEMAHWVKWAKAAYQDKIKTCAQELEVHEDCIVMLQTKSEVGRPAFLIALNHSKRAVVLSIRGTFTAADILTDLRPHSERFENGYAHSGMLNSARWLRDNFAMMLKDLMTSNGYRLVVTGHSLGAGAAALLSMLLRETNEKGLTILGTRPDLVSCWGMCCPPCVDKKMAEEATFIRCVVHQDDVVPRISPAALEDLRTEILQTDWNDALEDGSTRKKMVELAQTSKNILDQIEPALHYEKGELVKQVKNQGFAAVKGLTSSLAMTWTKATTGAYGAGAKQAVSLLAMGATAAGMQISTATNKVNDAIMQQMQLIEHDTRKGAAVTASSMAASAKVTNLREARDLLERNRLFVPGILYHVIRRPLQAGEKLPDGLPLGSGTSQGVEKDASSFRHIVVRGHDPSSRFQRIVLSTTLLSDHLCPALQDALADAMRWQHAGKPL